MTKILILSDFHTGHIGGLTHPDDQTTKLQEAPWEFFDKGLKKYKPFDVVFCNGDMIDGSGFKSGGTEQITTDRQKQSEMAVRILQHLQKRNSQPLDFFFTRGTPYHTGSGEDFEDIISKEFINKDGKHVIDNKLTVTVDEVTFNLKHKVASSAFASRANPLIKNMINAMIAEAYQDQVKADVFVRSHVHYFCLVETLGRLAFTTPALQFWSRYGDKECEGIVDFGFVVLDVDKGKVINLTKYINRSPVQSSKPIIWT